MTAAAHPAKFNDRILERIVGMFDEFGWPERILDPFAGTGKVHRLTEGRSTESVGVELEDEWASQHPNTQVGNALHLTFDDASFDCLCTSPAYGNRLADSHEAKDSSRRYSYRHVLGRKLHPDNSGQMQWGEKYREFHRAAWSEALRVLKPDSLIVINTSNHIRAGVEQLVTEWHMAFFLAHGCAVLDLDTVATKRLRHGANYQVRPRYENVFMLRYVAPVLTPDDPEETDEEDIHDDIDAQLGWGMADDMDTADGGGRP